MKLLPIVPGCLAWAMPHPTQEFSGATVTVKDKYDLGSPCEFCGSVLKWWLVENTDINCFFSAFCACRLTRIDGDPDAETRETEREIPAGTVRTNVYTPIDL